MSKEKKTFEHLELNIGDDQWSDFQEDQAIQIITHLSPNVKKLTIYGARFGKTFVDEVIIYLENS
jgi:hypothetical protein